MIKMNENMLKQIIIDTIKGEEHLGENIKRLCIDYIEQLQKQHADLNEHYNNMFECHCNRVQVEQLQNNWNELKKWLEEEKDRLARECSQIYEDSLGKTRLVNEDIYNEVKNISVKMQELEQGKDDK